MKSIIKNILLKLVYYFNCIVPKKENGIILYSFPDYSDNCRAIFEKIIEMGLHQYYDITWVVRDVNRFKHKISNARFVKRKSVMSLYHMCRSKYIIRTHSFWGNQYVKKKQVMCIAWHGMPVKGFTKAANNKPRNSFDHFNVTSPVFANVYSEVWNADIDRFDIVGLPRNDYMFSSAESLIFELGLNGFKKLIIWMPTFRSNTMRGVEGVQSEFGIPTLTRKDLSILNDKLIETNSCIIFKLHPLALDSVGEINYSNIRILEDSDLPDSYSLYHLIGQMDAMISDYSSVWVDYLLLDRPIGFAFDDLEEYKKTRKMVFDPLEDYMPGDKIRNINDLISFIDSLFETDRYIEERKRIRDIFITHQDGHSTERFISAIGIVK